MTQRMRRNRIMALVCAACTGVTLLLFALGPDRFWISERMRLWELGAKDVLMANFSPDYRDPRLVFIGIDQPTYADFLAPEELVADPVLAFTTNSFPWNRAVWASVIDRLAEAGAKAIILDLVVASPASGDDALRDALARHRDRVVIGANFLGGNKSVGSTETVLLPNESVLGENGGPPWNDPRVGFVNVFPDRDDVVRRAAFRVQGELGLPPDAVMLSLAARALERFGSAKSIPSGSELHLFRYGGAPGLSYKPVPLFQIFLPTYWTNNFQEGAFFKDKIVIVGPAANLFHDEHRTPFSGGSMLGPEIHLNIIAAALRGEFLGQLGERGNLASILLAGALAFIMALLIKAPLRRLGFVLAAIAAYWVLCWAVFRYADFYLLAVAPVIAIGTSSLGAFAYDFVIVKRERNRTRRTLERYVSKDVVREILDNPQTYLNTLGGVRKPVTILFSDVRGFTTMTEAADPAKLVLQLNEYFKEMVSIVFARNGSLDKFIGDAVMALWGSITTESPARDAQNAVAAALDMKKALARLNINWKQRGMPELAFGIGINHGEAIVGNLGSEQKMEVSVIGDPVNVASRLEGSTKEFHVDLLLGESVAALVAPRFALRSVDSVQFKGTTRPMRVFTVAADLESGEQAPSWLARYEEGVASYRERKFSEAAAAFQDCLRVQPDDYLARMYLERCQELLRNPPGPDWDTVFVMKSK